MIFNCIDNPITLNKKNYLERAAKRMGIELKDDGCVLNIEPYVFKKGQKWTGIWEIDLLLDRPEMTEENWSQADTIFTAISVVPERLQQFKTHVLFQACDPELHKWGVKPEYDVILSGSIGNECYKERERVYELIKSKFNFKDYGKNKGIADYVECCGTAKVQFIRSMKTPLGDGELAQRFFEGLAIGPVLTNYVPDLELTGLTEGKDYMAYRNDVEMLEKLEWMLKNSGKVDGREKALQLHTYEQRLTTILCASN